MGKRGVKSSAVKSAIQIPNRKGKAPWEKKGLSRAEKVIAFCESLPITSGIHAGQMLKLRDWQKDIVRGIYGTDESGTRLVRTALITTPRKQGKSLMASALALCHLVGPEAERRGQVYSAAADREQASIIFKELEAFILSVPEFSERCSIQSFRKTISDNVTGSIYTALTADGRKAHGLSPSFMIFDELAQAKDRELYDNLTTGTGARKEPLMIVISTQSPESMHVMSELVDYSEKITDGTLPPDKTFFGCVYKADDDADIWDEKVWHACNPALGDFRSLDEMRNFAEQAKKIPAKESTFRALYLNQRVDAAARWISSEMFRECTCDNMPDLSGRECYAGLDLSSTQDLSALSLCFVPTFDGEPYYTLHYSWCPKDAIKTRSKRDRVPYDLWAKQCYIEATPGSVIDYDFVLKRVEQIAKKYKLKAILFDRWGAARIVKSLTDAGHDVFEFGQGFASMSPPSKELEKLILSQKIVFPDNPVLSWCFSNVVAETDAAGNVKPSKKRSKEKIDLCVSTIMALDGTIRNQKKSIEPTITWI